MANQGFICFDGYLARTAKLSDQEVGRLFRACMLYHATGEVTELAGRESVAFDFIREDIDAANRKYAAKCEQNSENIRKRWTDTNGYDRIQPNTNVSEPIRSDTNGGKTKTNKKEKEKDTDDTRTELFDRFWAEYPNKVKKPDALRAWKKLNPDEDLFQAIRIGLSRWKSSEQWNRDGGRYIPHPATWLNARQWEDEVQARRSGSVRAQEYTQRDYTGEQDAAMRRMLDNLKEAE